MIVYLTTTSMTITRKIMTIIKTNRIPLKMPRILHVHDAGSSVSPCMVVTYVDGVLGDVVDVVESVTPVRKLHKSSQSE